MAQPAKAVAKSETTSATQSGRLDTVMNEARLFLPPTEFAAKARIKSLAEYEKLWNQAAADTEKFWGT